MTTDPKIARTARQDRSARDDTEADAGVDAEVEALTEAGGAPVGEDDEGDELIEGPNSK